MHGFAVKRSLAVQQVGLALQQEEKALLRRRCKIVPQKMLKALKERWKENLQQDIAASCCNANSWMTRIVSAWNADGRNIRNITCKRDREA